VTRITDGDTVHVDIEGQDYRLRYIGMDTPESVKPGTPVERYAKAATARNSDLVADRDVVLEKDVSETDRYGRLLRYVWLQDGARWTMVNLELVRTGYAHVLTYPPDVKYASQFVAAERAARAQGLGLWADDGQPDQP
jgi:micrococcal nuclease